MSFKKYELEIPGASRTITLEGGKTSVFVGANGSGKTRLGVHIEQTLILIGIVRIAAHRILTVSDSVSLSGFEGAAASLYSGGDPTNSLRQNRHAFKYNNKPATAPLNDYDLLLQALFTEQTSVAVKHLSDCQISKNIPAPVTVIMSLQRIWKKLLPHREIDFGDLYVRARPVVTDDSSQQVSYSASEMSDGERVILYLMGQCLLAPKDSAILIDEPELHIHKALMVRLWDIIEAERQDCAFIYISHDLDFVASRTSATKYAIRSFNYPNTWHIERMGSLAGLPEYVYTEIVGSRQPILFVEGDRGSLDLLTYRQAYPDFLVQPVGGCEAVIHAVSTFNKNSHIHRIAARGCIDADARQKEEIDRLKGMNTYALPVAEIENLYLLPEVFKALGHSLHIDEKEIEEKLAELIERVVQEVNNKKDSMNMLYPARVIDADLKKITPRARTIEEFKVRFADSPAKLDPDSVVDEFRKSLDGFIANKNLRGRLSVVDNKGLLGTGAQILGTKNRTELTKLAYRIMNSKTPGNLLNCFKAELPFIAEPAVLEVG